MSAGSPRISVLLPVRNGLPWIERALVSIFGQTFRDFELIALEDGSTDGTAELLTKVSEPRLRVAQTGGVGIARALNIGLAAARGEFIARHDADDESLPERFERQIAFLEATRDVDVLGTNAEYIDGDGRVVENTWVRTIREQQDPATTPERIRHLMPLTCCITHGSVMARVDILRSVGGYRREMVPAEDYDLWLRLLPARRFAKLSQRLYRHRLHSTQSSARLREAQIARAILAKLEYVRRLYPALPAHARLALAGGGRGAAYYAQVAGEAGFEPFSIDDPPTQLRSCAWDVAAITSFQAVDTYRRLLTSSDSPVDAFANFLVRVPRHCFVSRAAADGLSASSVLHTSDAGSSGVGPEVSA